MGNIFKSYTNASFTIDVAKGSNDASESIKLNEQETVEFTTLENTMSFSNYRKLDQELAPEDDFSEEDIKKISSAVYNSL